MSLTNSNLLSCEDYLFLYESQEAFLDFIGDSIPDQTNISLIQSREYLTLKTIFKENLRTFRGVSTAPIPNSLNGIFDYRTIPANRKVTVLANLWSEKTRTKVDIIEPSKYFLVIDKTVATITIPDKDHLKYHFKFQMFNILFEEKTGWIVGEEI
jgi:hypothetical protein